MNFYIQGFEGSCFSQCGRQQSPQAKMTLEPATKYI